MSKYLQLHSLTFYPPSNLNRGDDGRPKSCLVGNRERLRISSQCLKRTWRTSSVFQESLAANLGVRTKKGLHENFFEVLVKHGVSPKKAMEWSKEVSGAFAGLDKKKSDAEENPKAFTAQLVHYTPNEVKALQDLAERCANENRKPEKNEIEALRGQGRAVDVALFGRMLAEKPDGNVEAAVQVSHAFTINEIMSEEDYFTAVDDLNVQGKDAGAGHLDEFGFGSGVFYTYINIDTDLLLTNLDGNKELASTTIEALVKAVTTVSPSGKQNSFAAHGRAGYVYAESSDDAPRSLALAFMKPLTSCDLLEEGVKVLEATRDKLNRAYGQKADRDYCFNPMTEQGNLAELVSFAAEAATCNS